MKALLLETELLRKTLPLTETLFLDKELSGGSPPLTETLYKELLGESPPLTTNLNFEVRQSLLFIRISSTRMVL